MSEHPTEKISRYADGELPPEEARAVAVHLERCSECRRELALIRTVRKAMRNAETKVEGSVWEGVRRRIVGPAGWLLATAGAVILAALAAVEWFREGSLTLEWFATTALAVGFGLLMASIGWEQYREWKTSPYKDLER